MLIKKKKQLKEIKKILSLNVDIAYKIKEFLIPDKNIEFINISHLKNTVTLINRLKGEELDNYFEKDFHKDLSKIIGEYGDKPLTRYTLISNRQTL